MPVTAADFNLQGRVDNYRERLYELLVDLDGLVREQMNEVNAQKLGGSGVISYERQPPRWTLACREKGQRRNSEGNLMAFAQVGAWGIHARMARHPRIREPK